MMADSSTMIYGKINTTLLMKSNRNTANKEEIVMGNLTEREVLAKLGVEDFRHITKDKVMSFVSMMPDMDKDVAMKALEQMPDFMKLAKDALTDYKGVLEDALKNDKESAKECFKVYNTILDALTECAKKEDLSFEEKKYYIDEMRNIAMMADAKDSENKQHAWRIVKTAAAVFVAVVGVGAAALSGGELEIKVPQIPVIKK